MSALYPLVRNLSAFSTRNGVRTNPSRVGSSPSSTSRLRIVSCMPVFYILLHAASGVAHAQADPELLYSQRADLTRARQAADIWQMRIASDPKDFDSHWKLSRAMYWLGGHDEQSAR